MTTAQAYEELKEIHELFACDGKSLEWFEGVLHGMLLAGVLTDLDVQVWSARVRVCPGHMCNQSWCGYCGDLGPSCPEGTCNACDDKRDQEIADRARRVVQERGW